MRRCAPDVVVRDVVAGFAPSMERRGIVVEVTGAFGGDVEIDGDGLAQVVANLLSNVEKYAGEGARATVVVGRDDGGGLVVPVLRACESRDLQELNGDWTDLVERARKRRLKPDEYTGSTFQISNMGMFDVSYFDAIATPGLAAITVNNHTNKIGYGIQELTDSNHGR